MESWVRLLVDSAADEWAGWLWCCGRSHACCPCVCVCMCEVMGSEIVRNTGITGRSGAVRWDGCKTSPWALQSHTLRGGGVWVPRHRCLTYNAQTHTHTHMLLDVKAHHAHNTVCVQARVQTHKLQPCGRLSNCTHPTGLRSNQQD